MPSEEYPLEPVGDDSQRPLLSTTYKNVHFGKQLRRLLLSGARRWLVTALCIGAIYGTLAHYSDKVVMSNVKKRIFNGVITGLSIALGLSIASSLKWMASELKWWVLSLRGWTLQEVDLILHGESISHLLKLSHISRVWPTHIYVSLWILLNIASQVAVAMLGLTYSVGRNDELAITKPGDVRVSDLSTIKGERLITSTEVGTLSELQYTANSYGSIAVALGIGKLDEVPSPKTLTDSMENLYFCGTDRCEYYFSETSPREDADGHIQVTTDRSASSTGSCKSWPVSQGGDGNATTITITNPETGQRTGMDIPIAGGLSQTTFMVNTSQSCGPACSKVSAFEASATAPWFYECTVSIGNVSNAKLPEHHLGPNLTALATEAIALQGVGATSFSLDHTSQFQSYPAEAIYGAPQNGSATGMAQLMAQFAMGVLAVTAEYNPQLTVKGDRPVVGMTLDVNWGNVHLVLLITGCIQLVLTITAALLANRVVARDDGPLATARLLKPAINYPDDRASTASGKEIAKECGGNMRFVYGVRAERTKKGDVYHVQLWEGAPTPRPFPSGLYD